MDFMFFQGKGAYPLIKGLYDYFVNTEEYTTNAKSKAADNALDKVLDVIKNDITKYSYAEYEDILMSIASNYEFVGFMFGFKYALKLQQELY